MGLHITLWVTGVNPNTSLDTMLQSWFGSSTTQWRSRYTGTYETSGHQTVTMWKDGHEMYDMLCFKSCFRDLHQNYEQQLLSVALNCTLNPVTVSCNSYRAKWTNRTIQVQQKIKTITTKLTMHTVKRLNYTIFYKVVQI